MVGLVYHHSGLEISTLASTQSPAGTRVQNQVPNSQPKGADYRLPTRHSRQHLASRRSSHLATSEPDPQQGIPVVLILYPRIIGRSLSDQLAFSAERLLGVTGNGATKSGFAETGDGGREAVTPSAWAAPLYELDHGRHWSSTDRLQQD